jgi:Flp pilus assembly pilin Flp
MSALRSRRGATNIEYGLIAMLIGVALIGALSQLGAIINVLYTLVATLTDAAI